MLMGVVGKSNTGKSTFFKAATLAEVEIANYPFTTISKNEGVAYVKVKCVDKEFGVKCKPKFGYCLNNTRFVPVKLIDVAGLIPGAHKGLGRGNQFLDDLRQADVLIHVIDISGGTNEKGEPVETGSYDPAEDIKFLEVELDMWYLGIIKKGWEKFARQIMQEKKDIGKALFKQLSGLKVTEEIIENAIKEIGLDKEKPIEWADEEMLKLARILREKTKPMIIACNKIDTRAGKDNFARLEKEFPDHMLIGCSGESELALREAAKHDLIEYTPGSNNFSIKDGGKLSDNQKHALEFIKENVLEKLGTTGVQQVLDDAVFRLLGYIAVYPVANENKLTDIDGNVLPDTYLLPEGSTALDFAYKVHTDIGDKFNSAIDVRTKKRLGKQHVLKRGDVLKIITS